MGMWDLFVRWEKDCFSKGRHGQAPGCPIAMTHVRTSSLGCSSACSGVFVVDFFGLVIRVDRYCRCEL